MQIQMKPNIKHVLHTMQAGQRLHFNSSTRVLPTTYDFKFQVMFLG